MSNAPVLRVRDLGVAFGQRRRALAAVRDVSFDLHAGETLALVGESGCGKSAAVTALMRLHRPASTLTSGSARLGETDLLRCSERDMRATRGRRIAMIFQDPLSALNPMMSVGRQIAEVLVHHTNCGRDAAMAKAISLLDRVHVPDPGHRAGDLPHQLSGGMRQRVMIAMAIAADPMVLIADEPTTALDVTIQAQILALLAGLQRESGMAMILITHDLGVVSSFADRVAVMYAGRIVEEQPVAALFAAPRHPYTRALIGCRPRLGERIEYLTEIAGAVPSLVESGDGGCAFAPRCALASARCRDSRPPLLPFVLPAAETWAAVRGGRLACFHPLRARIEARP